MAVELTCPNCGRHLTVSDAAPRSLTCPRCLAHIDNPQGRDPSDEPLPVIPLDLQAHRDTRWSRVGLIALILLIAGGGVFVAIAGDGFGLPLFLLLIIGAVLSLAVGITVKTFRRPTVRDAGPSGYGPRDPRLLEYESRKARFMSEGASALAFMGGFLLALGVCAGGFFLLAATAGNTGEAANLVYLLLVAASVIGIAVIAARWNDRFRGVGPGVTVGLTLGMMALGPCGLCYLLSATGNL